MGKVCSSAYKSSEKEQLLEDVFEVVKELKRKNEVIGFFKELLFDSEIIMLGRRLQIARMLLQNKTYQEIRSELKVGINTIAAVRYSLDHGNRILLKLLRR